MRATLIALVTLACMVAPVDANAQVQERECIGSAPAAPTNYILWREASASISIRANGSFSAFRGGIGLGSYNFRNSSQNVYIFATMEGTLSEGRRLIDAGSLSVRPARVSLLLPPLHDRRGQRVDDYRLRIELGDFEKEVSLSMAGQRDLMVNLVINSATPTGANISLTPEEARTLGEFVFGNNTDSQNGQLVFMRNDGREIERIRLEFSSPSFRFQGLTQALAGARREYADNECRTRAQRERDIDEAYDDW